MHDFTCIFILAGAGRICPGQIYPARIYSEEIHAIHDNNAIHAN